MRINELGKELRKLRIEKDELLKDMAEKIGYSPSFLSAIETGRKKVPANFLERLFGLYELDPVAKLNFSGAVMKSTNELRLRLKAATPLQREAAFALARRLADLDDLDATQILQLLKGTEDAV